MALPREDHEHSVNLLVGLAQLEQLADVPQHGLEVFGELVKVPPKLADVSERSRYGHYQVLK